MFKFFFAVAIFTEPTSMSVCLSSNSSLLNTVTFWLGIMCNMHYYLVKYILLRISTVGVTFCNIFPLISNTTLTQSYPAHCVCILHDFAALFGVAILVRLYCVRTDGNWLARTDPDQPGWLTEPRKLALIGWTSSCSPLWPNLLYLSPWKLGL